MASNVYTKSEILQQLASRGYFIDAYTLDTFFKKWKIESIFEDEQGSEFYDKDVLNTVLDNLFGAKDAAETKYIEEEIRELKPNTDNKAKNSTTKSVQQIFQPQVQDIMPEPPVMQQVQPQYNYNQQFVNPNPQPQVQYNYSQQVQPAQPAVNMQQMAQRPTINDKQTIDILNNISLSDGTSLLNNVDGISSMFNDVSQTSFPNKPPAAFNEEPSMFDGGLPSMFDDQNSQSSDIDLITGKPKKTKKMGILEGAIELAKQDDAKIEAELASLGLFHEDLVRQPEPSLEQNEEASTENTESNQTGNTPTFNQQEQQTNTQIQTKNEADFDDISLLSESLEAQEKFKEYVISELQRKNTNFNPGNIQQGNEFKLDISERTITMIARTMAKKIAKNLNNIFSSDAKSSVELGAIKEEYKKLEQKNKELEEQNKKLRLLLSENKKYLNSFQPSIFGLYKKVNPDNVKEKKSSKEDNKKNSAD